MTIDRAIEILNPEHREHYDGLDEVNEACRMGMEALERTRWIPCSKRLPENDGWYLTVVNPEENAAFVGMNKFGAGTFITFYRVSHWKPMLELPWEANGNE